jgi:polysaccharide pyruvyl transferase WcaK-like protein
MAARIASYRSYRDKVSRDYMKRIGVNVVGDPVYPDLVFSLPLPTHATSKFYVNPAEHPKAVGLGVMTYYGWHLNQMISETIYQNYINKITKFVQWLLEHKYNVHVLIGEDSDDKAANDLLKKFQSNPGMNSEYSISYKPARTIYDVFQQISETDIVVASRFHNIVCALMLNRPVLSLGYADKNGALMAEMDLAKFDQHIENFDVDVLIQHFSEVAKDCASFIRRISEKNQEYRKILSNQFEELCATWKVRRPHR